MIKIIIAIAQRTLIIGGGLLLVFSLYRPEHSSEAVVAMQNKAIIQEGKGTEESIVFPFVIHMKTSKIVYDAPTLAVFHRGDWTLAQGSRKPVAIESGKQYSLLHWDIVVDTVYTSAIVYQDHIVQREVADGVPAAFLRVKDTRDGTFSSGWVYTGSLSDPPMNLPLKDSLVLVLQKSPAVTCWSDLLIMRDRMPHEIDPNTMFMESIPLLRLDSFILSRGNKHALPGDWEIEMTGWEGVHHNQPDQVFFRVYQKGFEWKKYLGTLVMLAGAAWLLLGRKASAKK
jgi:hypothetical protein